MLTDVFYDHAVDNRTIRQVIRWGNMVKSLLERERRRQHLARTKPKTIMNRAMTARPTRQLDAISLDYTVRAKANAFLPVVGRDREVQEAFRILQEGHSSVLLVGAAGVGKTSIVEGIAELMTAEDVPASLQDKRLVVTDPAAIIAGSGGVGSLEQRMQ